jgi:tetraacyldisaccharide 4'-kinase
MSHRSGNDLHVLLLAGIASPRQMMEDLSTLTPHITSLCFPDHHSFSGKDYRRINETFASLPQPRCIITTEKDAARLADGSGLSEEARQAIYVLPVSIKFMQDQANMFNEYILGYVRKNSRNSILVKGKDDNKSQDSHRAGDRTRTISFRNH